jgi:hypothetical protein
VELVEEIGAWVAVLVLVGGGVFVGVRERRRERARRRSVVAGKDVVYGPADSYRPRSALWIGLLFAWLAANAAGALLFVGMFPDRWRGVAVAAIVALAVLAVVVALRFLLDYARTEVVEGRVLERKVLYEGEDGRLKAHWIAVDHGQPGSISGTPVGPDDYARVAPGAWVRLHLTPRGRQVKRLEVVQLPESVNGFPAGLASLFPHGTEDLLVSPAQAARALGSPVEFVPVEPDTPHSRRYVYVPPGTKVINGTVLPPALHVTEAFDPEAANEVGRRVTAGRRRSWHHGNTGVFQIGATYVMTWGPGALVIRGQVDIDDVGEIGRLAHSLKPPGPGRR